MTLCLAKRTQNNIIGTLIPVRWKALEEMEYLDLIKTQRNMKILENINGILYLLLLPAPNTNVNVF